MPSKKDTTEVEETETTTKKAKKTKKEPKVEEKCVWELGTPCCGEVTYQEIFNHQLRVPICEAHLKEHKEICLLNRNGYDIEEVLNQTPEWRKQEALTLTLSGLDTKDIEI